MFIEQNPCINCGSTAPYLCNFREGRLLVVKCSECHNACVFLETTTKLSYSALLPLWNYRNDRFETIESYTEVFNRAISHELAVYYRRVVACLQNGGYL